MITITFPDKSKKRYPKDTSPIDIAKGISNSLAKKILFATLNDKQININTPIEKDGSIKFFTWDDDLAKQAFWHSSAHLLAQALESIYPNIKLAIGPPINYGFYYDVDIEDEKISEKDFEKIENKMLQLAKEKASFNLYNVSKKEAIELYKRKKNQYKLELINDLEDGQITFCKHSNFIDLCKGGHIDNTGFIKAIKLTKIAGAYWRGDEKNKQLTRIFGTSFPDKKMLNEHLFFIEEAKKRDHRKIGKQLDIFAFSEDVGIGLPLWLPNGNIIRDCLIEFIKDLQINNDYQFVSSPHIGNKKLYIKSGHYDKYGSESFQPIRTPNENEDFILKPMNCPHHCEIYKINEHSYKDLPIKLAEFGTVYRYEKSGEIHGISRTRCFTQDDAHIFCRPDQIKSEINNIIELFINIFNRLEFDQNEFEVQISLRDKSDKDKYIGTDDNWEKAERSIIECAEEKNIKTKKIYGEAAFYGPKLDFIVKDYIKRPWQLGTIQVDYNLPEKFDLTYKDKDNKKYRPIIIHRAALGSIERFVSILLENTKGNLPIWLAPLQVIILTISEKFENYAKKVFILLKKHDIRIKIDHRVEKIGKKIRDAEVKKIPYMLIVGSKEEEKEAVSVREHTKGDIGLMSVSNFIDKVNNDLKKLNLL